ncbi:MAG: class I SAM-dependent methyltransferase [Deltaproteobacteria bacterium]|jgi:SAM-dependent methyltransferase|nr:class I SAM-dependent methyltransferase [Deltaproteobacteria bacterium]
MIPEPRLNIWEHSLSLRELCRRRALDLEPEMDCAAQGAELLAPLVRQMAFAPKLLDVGCGGGHFLHSLKRRGLEVDYYGLDSSPSLIETAQKAFAEQNLDPARLMLGDVSHLCDFSCHLAVMINVLSFNPDFRAPLERLAETGAKALLIRDNFGEGTIIRWETDGFLDPGYNHLKGYWNQWSRKEVGDFLRRRGYKTSFIEDARTKGGLELVVEKPYYWSWLLAEKKAVY